MWCGLAALTLAAGAAAGPAPARSHHEASAAGPGWRFERLDQLGGPSRTVAVAGDTAYLGLGPSVQLLDVADPARPVALGRLDLAGIVLDLTIEGDRAYVLQGGHQLDVLDVADRRSPTVLGSLSAPLGTDEGFGRLVVRGGLAYLAGSAGLATVDVSDPAAARWLGLNRELETLGGLVLANGFLYLAGRDGALHVVSLAEPDRPRPVGRLSLLDGGFVEGLAVDHGYAFLTAWRPLPIVLGGPPVPTESYLAVVNLRDPMEPRLVGRYALDIPVEYPGPLAVAGDHAYVMASQYMPGGGFSEVFAYDISEPTAPRRVSEVGASRDGAAALVIDGRTLFIADQGGGLRTLDLTDPAKPAVAGHYDLPHQARSVAVAGGRAVIGVYELPGLWALDAPGSERVAPRGKVELQAYCWADCVAALGAGHAFIADTNGGFRIVDLGDPGAPRLVASDGTPRGAVAVEVAGSWAYVFAEANGTDRPSLLFVYDVAEPAAAREVARLDLPPNASDMAYGPGRVYALSARTLSVVDVSDPTQPRLIGSLDLGRADSRRLAATGDHLCVVDSDGTLHLLDAGHPSGPVEISRLEVPAGDGRPARAARRVVADAGIAYVLHQGWLQAVDISVPRSPRELAWAGSQALGAQGSLADLAVDGGRLYAVGDEAPLLVLRLRAPDPPPAVFVPLTVDSAPWPAARTGPNSVVAGRFPGARSPRRP
jgi:hypothetical protein